MAGEARAREPFVCAPGLRIEAHERLTQVQFVQLAQQLEKIEASVMRLERRLWLALYGVVASVTGQVVLSVLDLRP